MAPTLGNDTLSAAPISKVGSQSQQELSSGSTLTASTGGVPATTGKLMADVTAQLTLPQQSPTSRDKAINAIMQKQAAEGNNGDKSTKADDLSEGLESSDDGDKTPPGDTAIAELSPGKGRQSFENELSSRSANSIQSCWEGPIVFNDTTFGSLSEAAKKLNDPAYAGHEKMADYMKN